VEIDVGQRAALAERQPRRRALLDDRADLIVLEQEVALAGARLGAADRLVERLDLHGARVVLVPRLAAAGDLGAQERGGEVLRHQKTPVKASTSESFFRVGPCRSMRRV